MSVPNTFLMAEFDKQCMYFQLTSEIRRAINDSIKPVIGQQINRQGIMWAEQAVSKALEKFFVPNHIKVEVTRDIEDLTKLNIIFLDERPCDDRQYNKDLLGSISGIKRR